MKSLTRLSILLKLTLSTTLLLVATLPALVQAQLTACTFDGTEIEKCLNQQEGHISIKPCCATLNQAIQAGLYCLCSLIASSSHGPHLIILLSSSLKSGCEISIPALNLCQVSAPTPVLLPTKPEDPLPRLSPLTSSPTNLLFQTPSSPVSAQELYDPSRQSSSCNYMAGGRQLPCLGNGDTSPMNNWAWSKAYFMPSSVGSKAKTLLSLNWLIISVVCGELLLA